MVAAGDARYEVFHYLIKSLVDCDPVLLTRGQQPVAMGGYDTDSGLSDEGVLQCGGWGSVAVCMSVWCTVCLTVIVCTC